MKTLLHCDRKVLVVGDGDFSFTVALVKHSDLTPHQIYSSSLETETSILLHAQASQNMTDLKDLGVTIFLETDARDLHNHLVISREKFARVIFNFPLADRHNIKKNRSLLADFFLSCKTVLAAKGQVLVTLCKGQGGTLADHPVRSWHDSWQIVAMATNAGLFLHQVLPFDPSEFPEYHSVGFRFQDKSFNVSGALTHVFEEGIMVEDKDSNIRGTVIHNGMSYSCSGYVESRLNRNLLEETGNVLSIVRQELEQKLKTEATTKHLIFENSSSPIIPSHKSTAYLFREEGIEGSLDDSSSDMTKSDKDWKNCEILKRMNKTHLAHGVACQKEAERPAQNEGSCDTILSTYLPTDRENVYILVKPKEVPNEKSFLDGGDGTPEGKELDGMCSNTNICHNVNDCGDNEKGAAGGNDGFVSENVRQASCLEGKPAVSSVSVSECEDTSSLVYHCRTSLLESLPHLCHVLSQSNLVMGSQPPDSESQKKPEELHHKPGDYTKNNDPSCKCSQQLASLASITSPSSTTSVLSGPESQCDDPNVSVDSLPHSFPCLVASGQCMVPCAITPVTIPTKHEMLILHQLTQTDQISQEDSKILNEHHFNFISSKILSFLQSLTSRCLKPNLSLLTNDSGYKVTITNVDESQLVNHFVLSSDSDEDSLNLRSPFPETLGCILNCRMGQNFYHVTLVNLQSLVCHRFGIDDPRLLWSDNEKFLCQFKGDLSLCQYCPFSLYPMKFLHDLSFWEREMDSESFDVFGLWEVIRNIAGDLVINVKLIDVYEEPDSKRKSRCYRLYFQSLDRCLSYVTSWKLQSKIRIEVARSLGVQLR